MFWTVVHLHYNIELYLIRTNVCLTKEYLEYRSYNKNLDLQLLFLAVYKFVRCISRKTLFLLDERQKGKA